MDESLASIDNYPLHQILREDDHIFCKSAYFQVHQKSFQFDNYNHGTKALKQLYGITPKLYRYFNKRHFLFSRFEQGILIDEESWYSVIPQSVSLYLLQRIKSMKFTRVFQPFCGIGGIAVHMAGHFEQYVANDIDKNKLDMLENNLEVYEKKESSLTLINQDFLQVQPFPTDVLIICPPWGGIETFHYASSDLDAIMVPQLTAILTHALKFSTQMILQMPKQTNISNLISILHRSGIKAIFTIEKIQTNQRCSQLFFYFGSQSFSHMNGPKLNLQIIQDTQQSSKADKKKIKAFLKDQASKGDILSEIYRSKYPNKRILFL